MSILFCEGCGEQLRKFKGGKIHGKLVVAKKSKTGKWLELKKKLEEGVEKDEKIFFKCLNCDFLNTLPESMIQGEYQKRKNNPPTSYKR